LGFDLILFPGSCAASILGIDSPAAMDAQFSESLGNAVSINRFKLDSSHLHSALQVIRQSFSVILSAIKEALTCHACHFDFFRFCYGIAGHYHQT